MFGISGVFTTVGLLFNQWTVNGGVCPFLLEGTPLYNITDDPSIPDVATYEAALDTLDINAVFQDLYAFMTGGGDTCWPPDTFSTETSSSYAGLMLRLAWHCAGTFRDNDGEGGCAGGRQRYEPEAGWDDNVNLDKARALLYPIKEKYGDALSWGDLFVFAGTAAILQGGGPVTEVCAGRIDQVNGDDSDVLNDDSSCNIQGNCTLPLGSQQVGLIYVDAAGYLGEPDPIATAPQIREVFARMGVNDSETVALIGGGHAFGKAHGACPDGPGDGPEQAPYYPWPGACGTDFPTDAYTSGFEGQWTTYPFTWDNEYFTQLLNDNYTLIDGDGDKPQWLNMRTGYLMLTTDIALLYDDDYLEIVTDFATNQDSLDTAFGNVWAKLVTSGTDDLKASNWFCVDGSTLAEETGGETSDDDAAFTAVASFGCLRLFCVAISLIVFIGTL